jgi:hypothetical protein
MVFDEVIFDEVIFDEVINPRFVAVCLKMGKNRPKGKRTKERNIFEKIIKMISTANILIVWQKDKMKLTKDYY